MPPRISVVVSTHDRPAGLERLLGGLAAQTLAPADYELIVVDDGSPASTAALLTRHLARAKLPITVVRNDRSLGAAAGRNRGWALARAPLVAFTDDDCLPEPGWLVAMLAAADRSPGCIVQGVTVPDEAQLAATEDRRLFVRRTDVTAADLRFETCNIAYPRDVLARLEGFDEAYSGSGGEDTDLGWRAREVGVPVAFCPAAVVRHDVVDLGPWGKLAYAGHWAICARTFARHPAARVTLYRDAFWNVWHYLLVRTVLVLAAPLPRILKGLLLARYAVVLERRAAAAGAGPTAIPFLLAFDTVELVAMLRASLANRTLLI